MIRKGDTLRVNPQSRLGKTNDTENKKWYLIVDKMPENGDRYIYCYQTTRDRNDTPICDTLLLRVPLVLDPNNVNKAYTIGKLEDGVGDKNAEDDYIRNHPDDYYLK
jgi:hypothetical protein